jgi:hypothetical protein
MATVASVVAVVVVHVTSTTFRGVVLVETEVFVVIERGRGPAFLSVTLPAVALDIIEECRRKTPDRRIGTIEAEWLSDAVFW